MPLSSMQKQTFVATTSSAILMDCSPSYVPIGEPSAGSYLALFAINSNLFCQKREPDFLPFLIPPMIPEVFHMPQIASEDNSMNFSTLSPFSEPTTIGSSVS
jgi:hypothetical protein